MTILEHLEELRSRIIKILFSTLVGFLLIYTLADVVNAVISVINTELVSSLITRYFTVTLPIDITIPKLHEYFFEILMRPLIAVLPEGTSFIFTSPTEAFFTYLKVAILAAVFLASPYIVYQIWAFVSPGLYKKERGILLPVAFFSALFFVGGACFGYFIVFPWGFKFLISSFATEIIKPMPTLKEYFTLATRLLIAFGVIFELPLVILILSRLGLVSYRQLRKYQKYAVLGIFVVGAMLTPPDVVTQLMMAGPLIILYEISIWVAFFFGKKTSRWEVDEEEEDEEGKEDDEEDEKDEKGEGESPGEA
jgi:sec-independent protein translocase protein TatC